MGVRGHWYLDVDGQGGHQHSRVSLVGPGSWLRFFLVQMLHFYFVVQHWTQDASPASLEPFTSRAQRVLVTRVTSVLFPLLCLSLGLSPHL